MFESKTFSIPPMIHDKIEMPSLVSFGKIFLKTVSIILELGPEDIFKLQNV